eukprot:614645-Pelagomonas_calceolata.AAC.6
MALYFEQATTGAAVGFGSSNCSCWPLVALHFKQAERSRSWLCGAAFLQSAHVQLLAAGAAFKASRHMRERMYM